MDRNSIIGFVVIGLIMIIWLFFMNKTSNRPDEVNKQTIQDTIKKESVPQQNQNIPTTPAPSDTLNKYSGTTFANASQGTEDVVIIETDKYHAEFSSKGGSLIKYEVKGFNTWDGHVVQLLKLDKAGELNMIFNSKEGKMVNTRELFFTPNYYPWQNINLTGDQRHVLQFELMLNEQTGAKIVKTYILKNNSYDFGLDIELVNSSEFVSNFEYQLVWDQSLKLTEYRSDQEGTHADAFASMGDDLEIVSASDPDELITSDKNGSTNWVLSRIKYFCVALIADNPKGSGSYITGTYHTLPENGFEKNYSIGLKLPIRNDKYEKYNTRVYLGPVDYEILKGYNLDLESTMRFSLDFIVRPIAQYFILPIFLFIHKFITNWGLVIIIFSILMKLLLTPFTRAQTKSMKKMAELQPRMTEIKAKYKDDPAKQQQAIMKFYKEEKINPAGGCLPLLLQMPILYALFGVFNSTIELRQAYFGLWINDLSIPDVIVQLPFKIPLFGIDYLSGLAILMGITMFIQQKMTVKDPAQKGMVYIMPVMLTLLFTTLPAGLNLYYFMFNLLSIAEQYYITHIKTSSSVPVNEKPVKQNNTPRKK